MIRYNNACGILSIAFTLIIQCKPLANNSASMSAEEKDEKYLEMEAVSTFIGQFYSEEEVPPIYPLTDLHWRVSEWTPCVEADKTLFPPEIGNSFHTVFSPEKPMTASLLEQATIFKEYREQQNNNFDFGRVSGHDINLALRQTKVLMAYKVFETTYQLVYKRLEENIDNIEALEKSLISESGRNAKHEKIIELLFNKWKQYHEWKPFVNSADFSIKKKINLLLNNYPILKFFPETVHNPSRETFEGMLRLALSKLKGLLKENMDELSIVKTGNQSLFTNKSDLYNLMLYFPIALEIALDDEAKDIVIKSDYKYSKYVMGSYCQLISDLMKKAERDTTIKRAMALVGAVIAGTIALPIGISTAAVTSTAITSADIYSRYQDYQRQIMGCQGFMETSDVSQEIFRCSESDLNTIEATRPKFIQSAAEILLGASAPIVKLGRRATSVFKGRKGKSASAARNCGLRLTACEEAEDLTFNFIHLDKAQLGKENIKTVNLYAEKSPLSLAIPGGFYERKVKPVLIVRKHAFQWTSPTSTNSLSPAMSKLEIEQYRKSLINRYGSEKGLHNGAVAAQQRIQETNVNTIIASTNAFDSHVASLNSNQVKIIEDYVKKELREAGIDPSEINIVVAKNEKYTGDSAESLISVTGYDGNNYSLFWNYTNRIGGVVAKENGVPILNVNSIPERINIAY